MNKLPKVLTTMFLFCSFLFASSDQVKDTTIIPYYGKMVYGDSHIEQSGEFRGFYSEIHTNKYEISILGNVMNVEFKKQYKLKDYKQYDNVLIVNKKTDIGNIKAGVHTVYSYFGKERQMQDYSRLYILGGSYNFYSNMIIGVDFYKYKRIDNDSIQITPRIIISPMEWVNVDISLDRILLDKPNNSLTDKKQFTVTNVKLTAPMNKFTLISVYGSYGESQYKTYRGGFIVDKSPSLTKTEYGVELTAISPTNNNVFVKCIVDSRQIKELNKNNNYSWTQTYIASIGYRF